MKFKTNDLYVGNKADSERVALKECAKAFSKEMKKKLFKKMETKSGWDSAQWVKRHCKKRLIAHIEKGDMVDVANLAMFLWNAE